MNADYYQSNLASIAKRYPFLADRLRSLPPNSSVEVSGSEAGEPTANVLLPDGSQKRLHSRRDPRREVARWAESHSVGLSKTVALFGLGLGYPAEEFLRKHRKNLGGLWCFESSLDVFRAMLSWKDWRWLIEEPRVYLFVGVTEGEFRALTAGRFQDVIVNGVDLIEYPPCVQVDPVWYQGRQENLRDLLRQWASEMTTVMERGRLFLANTLWNLRDLVRGRTYLIRDLATLLRERPAILVSAGPSLNKNASRLKEAKGKILIVAVDTALRVLQKHGVEPDLLVSIDALGMSKGHFEGVNGLENIPLAYDLEVTPEVSARYPGPRFLVGNNKPALYSWLEEVTGPLEGLTKGLTVAQAAFLLLAHCGSKPIVLVGQDLSFEREGGKTHAEGVAFQGRFEPDSSGQGRGKWEDPLNPRGFLDVPILWVRANDGGQVPTTHALFAYLKRLEDDIALTGAEVVNATEGGASIRGTRVATLETILQEILASGSPPFEEFRRVDGLETVADRYGSGLEDLHRSVAALLGETQSVCEEGFRASDKLWRDLAWKDFSPQDLQKRMEEVFRCFSWIQRNPKVQMLIDRGVMRALYMLHKGDLPPPEKRTREDRRAVAERYRTFFADALDTIADGLKILQQNPEVSER